MGTLARTSRILAAASLAAAVLASVGAGAAPADPGARAPGGPRFTAGADGAGDRYFPRAGNGGYDVSHYDLDIDYDARRRRCRRHRSRRSAASLEGVATIDLVARQDLDRFNLDLRGMTVSALTVNGKRATGIAPPADGAEVEGAAYWHVQDDADRRWELTVQPRPKLKAGQSARVVVTYGGETTRPDRHRGSALRVGHHARRGHGRQRAGGVDDVVPGQ